MPHPRYERRNPSASSELGLTPEPRKVVNQFMIELQRVAQKDPGIMRSPHLIDIKLNLAMGSILSADLQIDPELIVLQIVDGPNVWFYRVEYTHGVWVFSRNDR